MSRYVAPVYSLPRAHEGEVEVAISFRHGWCTLSLDDGTSSVSIKATTIFDSFRPLVDSVRALADGENCRSVLWQGEGRAHFVDFVRDAPDRLGVAVHRARDIEGLLAREPFRPVRGEVEFECTAPFAPFITMVADVLRLVEIGEPDATGYIRHWGHRFPRAAFLELERLAEPLGYTVRAPEEYEQIREVRTRDRPAPGTP